jgi:GNAT superfamily N-acetyltransferase
MADMLVKLYNLQVNWPNISRLEQQDIWLRKPLGSETRLLATWVEQQFSQGWASEVAVALHQRTCLIAVQASQVLGFACYDAAALGLFGPMGIVEAHRGQGLGQALLQLTLFEMKQKGYAYAIIGWVGPAEFYERTVGATLIPDSSPGLWQTRLALTPSPSPELGRGEQDSSC